MANLLLRVGIRTARPLAFVESRWPLSANTESWLISDYIEGVEVSAAQGELSADNLDAILRIFENLKRCEISHGDCKPRNFLLDKRDGVALIDLDAMRWSHRIDRDSNRDVQRFIQGVDTTQMPEPQRSRLLLLGQ